MPDEPDEGRLQIFVYGTLLPGEVNYELLLSGRTCHEEPATLRGARMWANGDRFALTGRSWPFPFVALTDDQRATVTGYVMTVDQANAADVLLRLDELETFTPGSPANRYERVRVSVTTSGGERQCWVYVAAERIRSELDELPPITDGDWLGYLREV
ncbi:MAG: gamma-glutamylcyclotransferase family protein [Candidatus Nanopelagicales bacterium]